MVCGSVLDQASVRLRAGRLLIVSGILGAVWLIGRLPAPSNARSDPPLSKPYEPAVPKYSLEDRIRQTDVKATWSTSGSVALFDLTIRNLNDVAITNVVVLCKFFGNSGSQIQTSQRTVYERLLPGATKIIKKLNFGFVDQQATRASCQATMVGGV